MNAKRGKDDIRRCGPSCPAYDFMNTNTCRARVNLGLAMQGEEVTEGQECKYNGFRDQLHAQYRR